MKTRSEQQVSKLKQANLKLATKVGQLEQSCVEKVRTHFDFEQVRLPAAPPRQADLGSFCKVAMVSLVSSPESGGLSGAEEPRPCLTCLCFPWLQRGDSHLCPTCSSRVALFYCSEIP